MHYHHRIPDPASRRVTLIPWIYSPQGTHFMSTNGNVYQRLMRTYEQKASLVLMSQTELVRVGWTMGMEASNETQYISFLLFTIELLQRLMAKNIGAATIIQRVGNTIKFILEEEHHLTQRLERECGDGERGFDWAVLQWEELGQRLREPDAEGQDPIEEAKRFVCGETQPRE